MATLSEIRADFELLDDWEDRYRYIIELGRTLPRMEEALMTDATKVQGCVSQVWLVSRATERPADKKRVLSFVGTSDAAIVRGLIAILFSLYQEKGPNEILAIEPDRELEPFGLKEHLTPQRSNGLASMVKRIKSDAEALAEQGAHHA